jgi:hypothetical protein
LGAAHANGMAAEFGVTWTTIEEPG